jgi:hypothetical protein
MIVAAMIGSLRRHSMSDHQAMIVEEWAERYVRAWTPVPGAFVTISERGGNWMVLLGVYNPKGTGSIVQALWGAVSGQFSNTLAAQARDEVLAWFRNGLPPNAEPLITSTLQELQVAKPCSFEFEQPRATPVVTAPPIQPKDPVTVLEGELSRVVASSKWTPVLGVLQALTLLSLVAAIVWTATRPKVPVRSGGDAETMRLQLGTALASYELLRKSAPEFTGMSDQEMKTIAAQIKAVLASCPHGQSKIAKPDQCATALNQLDNSSDAVARELKARDNGNTNRKELRQLEQWSTQAREKLNNLSSGERK